MFLSNGDSDCSLEAVFAPNRTRCGRGGHNMLQGEVVSRKPWLVEVEGARTFPWRVVAIADQDRQLADCDIVWRLASECRLDDISWIEPGKVALGLVERMGRLRRRLPLGESTTIHINII